MKHKENIMVIPVENVPRGHRHNAFTLAEQVTTLLSTSRFLPRYLMEDDENFKQVIPYVVVINKIGNVLTYQRSVKSGEDRLHAKYSIGFGGHIDEVEGESGSIAFNNSMVREIEEELGLITASEDYFITSTLSIDNTPVDRVHIGVVAFLELDNSQDVVSKGELDIITNRKFMPLEELMASYDTFEPWSQVLIDSIIYLMAESKEDTLKQEKEALRQDLLQGDQ